MSLQKTTYGFIPTSISGCVLWLDGADSSTVTLSSSSIIQWNDKSTSTNHFVQATTANSPTVGTSQNGLPTIYFASANQQLVSSQNSATSGNASRTVIQVFWCPTLTSAYYSVTGTESGADPPQAWGFCKNANNDVDYPFMYSTAGYDVYSIVNSTPNPLITYAQYNSTGSSLSAYYATSGATNGTTTVGNFTTKSMTFNTTAGVWYLGRRQQAATGSVTSHLLEMIHFNKALSTTERQQVEGYLSQKWSLSSLLSAGHPGLTTTIYRSDYKKQNIMTPISYYTQFSPRQISGCALWLDAADPAGNGVIPANNSTLSTWVDKSGNGVNVTGSSLQPTFLTNAFNGKPTVSFAAVQGTSCQFLTNSSTNLYNSVTNISIFMVIYIPATTPNFPSPISLFGKVTIYMKGGYSGGISAGSLYPWTYNNTGPLVTSLNNYVSANNYYLCSFQFNTNQTFFMNGDTGTGGPTAFTFGSSTGITTYIGYSGYNTNDGFNGYISEIITYNTAVSTAQRQQVESYLVQKWGLTTSLAGGHPHFTKQTGAVTTVTNTKYRMTGIPRITFASTGLVITHQDGRPWKATANNPGYANYAIGLNSGTSMSLNIYAGSDVFNSAGGRVALFNNGDSNNAVRHAGYVMWTYTFAANNFDWAWKFVSSGSGYLIYNDYPSYSSWQVSYDPTADRVLIVAPGDAKYGMVWNITPKVTLSYVYSSY